MQAEFAGRANVHRRTFAHGFDAAKDFDGSGVVLVARAFGRRIFFFTHSLVLLRFRIGKAVARTGSTITFPIGLSALYERELKLEGFSLHPAPFGGSGGARRRPEGPLRAVFKRADEFFLGAFWREREEKTTAKNCVL